MPTTTIFRRISFLSYLTLPLMLAACGGGEAVSGGNAVEEPVAADDAGAAEEGTSFSRKSEWSIAGIVRGKSETKVEPAPAPPPPRRQAAGLLTAGDHDDLLNPELYAAYAGRFLQKHGGDLPFVDTRTRVAIKIVDADGRAVPFAKVDVQRRGPPLHLVAAADGVASFYPRFDSVPAKTTVEVQSEAGSASRAVDLAGHGARRIAIALPGTAQPVAAMDLALVVDTTGSMGDEMAYLQAELDSILARLKRESGNLDLRIGLIAYRDEGDDYVVRAAPLSSDVAALRATLADQEAGGGGDTPEAVDQAIAAAGRLQWRTAAAKAILLVADAPPHADRLAPTLAATQKLRARGVQIVPVAASGVEESAQYVMRTMAALTQGRYIFLTDDSGVGDAHAEPDLACYVVSRLDQVIARVLAGIVEGRRIEPAREEIVRTVGHYDRGRCNGAGATPLQS
ncbi:VWA domain-containing protein [Sphingosinicella sp. BN140058]|uniref:vWA domain-containing protein n=1 Tax=Sphingosinicella sp. BN140058 TaxID=1892855 RepID=UPI0013E9A0E0|nr:vWA domain-containing protein [Sphingosinicella sp. BN140058]